MRRKVKETLGVVQAHNIMKWGEYLPACAYQKTGERRHLNECLLERDVYYTFKKR